MQGSRLDLDAGHAFTAGELRPRDLAVAVLVSLAAHALVLLAAQAGADPRKVTTDTALEVVEEAPIPVSVVYTAPEGPLLKLGGARAQARTSPLPPAPAPASRAEQTAVASQKGGESAEDVTPLDSRAAPAAEAPAPLNAEPAKQLDAALTPSSDGVDGASDAAGPGSPDGAPDGTEADPLKARAVDLYRARLIAWFASRFRVSGSGLPPDELTRSKVSATVHLSDDRRVESFSIDPSGSAPFDAAARAALERARGEALPPPPESYPDIVQRTIRLTFVCRSGQCD